MQKYDVTDPSKSSQTLLNLLQELSQLDVAMSGAMKVMKNNSRWAEAARKARTSMVDREMRALEEIDETEGRQTQNGNLGERGMEEIR